MNPTLLGSAFGQARAGHRIPLFDPPRDRAPSRDRAAGREREIRRDRDGPSGRGLRPFGPAPDRAFDVPGAPTAAFAALFHALEALRVDDRPIVLQFVGADAACDTAAVAAGLARTAREALDPGPPGTPRPGPVLVVDAVAPRPSPAADLLGCVRRGRDVAEAAIPTGEPGIAWAGLARMSALSGPEAGRLLDAIRARFALGLLDCGPVGDGGATPPLARHCDGTVLVCRAERSRLDAIEAARTAIERAGGRLLGAVVQDGGTRLPRWLSGRL